jgi:ABC-type bacteriocin/lantibiotic exporter with double-glycine peptidase domain
MQVADSFACKISDREADRFRYLERQPCRVSRQQPWLPVVDIFWELRGFFRAHWRSYCLAGAMLAGVALLGLLPPVIIGRVVDGIMAGSLDGNGLLLHAATLVGCAIGIYVLRFLWRQTLYGASYRLSLELRQAIYAHLLQLSPEVMARCCRCSTACSPVCWCSA